MPLPLPLICPQSHFHSSMTERSSLIRVYIVLQGRQNDFDIGGGVFDERGRREC